MTSHPDDEQPVDPATGVRGDEPRISHDERDLVGNDDAVAAATQSGASEASYAGDEADAPAQPDDPAQPDAPDEPGT